jgi:hypothetical protein
MMCLYMYLDALRSSQLKPEILKDLWIEVYVLTVIPETVTAAQKDGKSAHGYLSGRADLLDSCGDVIRVEANVSNTSANNATDFRKQLLENFHVDHFVCMKRLTTPSFKAVSNVAATFQMTSDIRTSLSAVHTSGDSEEVNKGGGCPLPVAPGRRMSSTRVGKKSTGAGSTPVDCIRLPSVRGYPDMGKKLATLPGVKGKKVVSLPGVKGKKLATLPGVKGKKVVSLPGVKGKKLIHKHTRVCRE